MEKQEGGPQRSDMKREARKWSDSDGKQLKKLKMIKAEKERGIAGMQRS